MSDLIEEILFTCDNPFTSDKGLLRELFSNYLFLANKEKDEVHTEVIMTRILPMLSDERVMNEYVKRANRIRLQDLEITERGPTGFTGPVDC